MRFPLVWLAAVLVVSPTPTAAQWREPSPVAESQNQETASTGPSPSSTGATEAVVPTPTFAARASPPPRRKKPRIGVNGYLLVESVSLTAAQTFTAVVGTSRVKGTGGGVDVINLWQGAFARVSFARTNSTGSRVFVDSSQHAFSLHIPLTVTTRPLEIGGGWRFSQLDTSGHVVPYLGAAIVRLRYTETSEFAEADENTDETFKGGTVFAGLDVSLAKIAHLAVEGQYRRVPQALDIGGALGAFRENDLGGTVVRFRVGVVF